MAQYYQKKSFLMRQKEKLSKGIKDSTMYKLYKKITSTEKEEFQKEYSFYFSSLFREVIEKMNGSGLVEYLEGSENDNENEDKNMGDKKKGKLKRSFPNIFHPDFSYRFVGEYLINENSSNEHLAYFCSILSKIVYERKTSIKKYIDAFFLKETTSDGIELFEVIKSSHKKYDTFCMVLKFISSDLLFVVFRGTKFFSIKDWSTDFEMNFAKIPKGDNSKEHYKVHEGFYNSLCSKGDDKESVFDKILIIISKYYLNSTKLKIKKSLVFPQKVIACGHSLGGGIGSIFSIKMALNGKGFKSKENNNFTLDFSKSILKVFTFGAPNIGDDEFVEINQSKCFRYVNDLDLVPAVPEWMKSHGTDVQITKYLPIKMQQKVRISLPLIMYSMYDHFPGEYVSNIAKQSNFICGRKNWDNEKTKQELKQKDLLFQNGKLKSEIELLKEKMRKKDMENSKLKMIVVGLKKNLLVKDEEISELKNNVST